MSQPSIAPAPGLALPELNDELRFILGRPNFMCAGIANVLRAKGADIKCKAEDEQAAVLYWMLGLYLEHGVSWREQAELELSSKPEGGAQ